MTNGQVAVMNISGGLPQLASTDALLDELRAGRPIIVVDDESRENEGDIIIAAEHATESLLAFAIRYTGGVVCLAMTNRLADHLELWPMVQDNTAPLKTAYTVSIEAKRGVTTGISARDRAITIRATVREGVTSSDFTRPGHVFPLRARDGGVLERRGHTEAAVDLCRLAGLSPVGAISELMEDDGTMMRLSRIMEFARQHGLKVGTIADLVSYRLEHDSGVRRVARAKLPVRLGEFDIHGFQDASGEGEHVAMTLGEVTGDEPPLVRLHSECLTGDVFGSLRCDCGVQRAVAMENIAREGRGVLVYLRQEGRGIGLLNKLCAYSLQDDGADTVEANAQLGFAPDLRDYRVGAQILRSLGIRSVRLMTNNPRKVAALQDFGMRVVERIALNVGKNPHNVRYLATKAEKMGHLIL